MQELALNSDAMKLSVQLRRILHNDHGVKIALDDDFALEQLFDSARDARDRKTEELAHQLCDSLRALNRHSKELKICERLSPTFRAPVHEKMVGANPGYVYRGQRIKSRDAEPQAGNATGDTAGPAPKEKTKENKVIIYRGQRIVA